ncbi:MAG: hypothetical protein ACREJ9_18500 [Candidatus Rokuibacteriota bacterium]
MTGSVGWSRGVLFGPVAGVLAFVATDAFLRSLQAPGAQVGVNAAIYRLNLAVAAVLAIVGLGEAITTAKIDGLSLAVVAVLLLSEISPRRAARVPGGVTWAALAMVAFGAVFFLYKASSPPSSAVLAFSR